MELLFSYGTLRSKQVQMQIFNKVLSGSPDQILGFKLKSLQIEEEFGMADYVVAVPIIGVVVDVPWCIGKNIDLQYKVCLDLENENRLKTYRKLLMHVTFVSCVWIILTGIFGLIKVPAIQP